MKIILPIIIVLCVFALLWKFMNLIINGIIKYKISKQEAKKQIEVAKHATDIAYILTTDDKLAEALREELNKNKSG